MTSQSEREFAEELKRLEEKFEISSRLTIVERDLAAANEATRIAFIAKEKHDDEHNQILDALKDALGKCISEDEYNRRHDQLIERITMIERNMWKMIGGLIALWAVIQVAQHFAK